MIEYNEAVAKATERTYLMPEIAMQRAKTMAALQIRIGEHVLDVGCGMGLLTRDLGLAVGETGHVHGLDNSGPMINLAQQRCGDIPQITLEKASAEGLDVGESKYDAAICTQLLLYLQDPQTAVNGMYRALKKGGRIGIIETDWRGVVFNSSDDQLTRKLMDSWEAELPSPHLPSKLQGMLRQAGFSAVHVEAIPIVETSFHPDNYSSGMIVGPRRQFVKRGLISQETADNYVAYLQEQSDIGNYFFCVNRFLFTAVK